ncbi:hypothetical protein [Vibrio algivorus]|uniref:Lipoprotein n=1 Tax=Vibrio algivorus TaxID=1667024 RepID=A0ABQ6ELF1_9VIBR|nr:hypothetical protein [Vibrio algivorus]GLT13727.1 hypothetical protein GCM10007931_07010 [Vibrio algivorus]
MKNIKHIILATAAVLLIASCTPYASLDIGAPFKIGPVYVNPSIGVGGNLK